MCGIVGILRFDDQTIDVITVEKILQRLAHRGQDHSGIEISTASEISNTANVAFGHRRLSIIDLSDDASQPMSYSCEKLWITFNGEIYNYIELKQELLELGHFFHTKSDTEVILAAYSEWGKNCLEHLNGMFAFALWDEEKQQLFCARDELGVKPFYYYQSSGFIVFASESKALYEFHQNKLNLDSVASYMLSLYIPSDWSVFEGVKKLLPAHYMTVSREGKVVLERYWSVQKFADIDDDLSSREQMSQCLKSAVEMQLRSDVPVGVLLSGGVDSGMIVAMASETNKNLHTYSVGFEGMAVNELCAAAEVAKKYRTNHHEKLITDEEAIQALDSAIQCLTEPMADPALVPSYILSKMAANDGMKVLLSGSGGDEVFGGYTRYAGGTSLHRNILNRIPEGTRTWFGRLLPPTKLSARLKNVYLDMMFNTSGNFELCASTMNGSDALNTMLEKLAASFPITSISDKQCLLYKQMVYDKNVYLPDDLLLLLDQMGMAHTIEGRVPLIDKRVVEKSFRFPPISHVKDGKTKKLFREIAENYLGYEHVWRKKQGFAGPVSWWVNQNCSLFCEVAVSIKDIPNLHHMDVSALLKRVNRQGEVGQADSHALFILYCFRRWYDSLEDE